MRPTPFVETRPCTVHDQYQFVVGQIPAVALRQAFVRAGIV